MEAMAKLKEGQKFSEVATAYSEDKARQGVMIKLEYAVQFNQTSLFSLGIILYKILP